MGDHPPPQRRPDEYVGGEDTKVTGPTLEHAADVFHTSNPAAISGYRHVNVLNVEVHQGGVLEDSPPAVPYGLPAYDGLPARVDA